MRRALILVLVACLAVCAPAALAQDNPFTPLTPATPVPTAVQTVPPTTTTSTTSTEGQSDISRGVLFAVAGVIAVVFLAIGIYVTRDARRSLTDADRRELDRDRELAGKPRTPEQHAQAQRAKEKARAAGKRQRQARKAGRKR